MASFYGTGRTSRAFGPFFDSVNVERDNLALIERPVASRSMLPNPKSMLSKAGHNVRVTKASKAPCTSEAQRRVSFDAKGVTAVSSETAADEHAPVMEG